jgi:hypothetical protein
MSPPLDRITKLTRVARRTLMISCWLALALAIVANCLCVLTSAQDQGVATVTVAASQNLAPRIVLPVRGSRDVVFDVPVVSATVVDPEFVAVEVKGATLIKFIALREGETIVIVSGGGWRRTYMVEVRPRPAETAEQLATEEARRQRALLRPTGVYSISFSPSFGNAPAFLRQSFDYRRKLAGGRTLRVSVDTFKFFGGGERGLINNPAISFGLDRLTLGVDTRDAKLDLLDSELNLSPLTFDGYTMRGVHLSSATASRLRGLEFFAGLARPSLALFDNHEGYVGGALLPIARGASWRVRAGMYAMISRRDRIERAGGIVLHADGRYAPDERTRVEGELAFANGAFSWRARLDLQRGPFVISGESLRLDRRSPLVQVGAQSGGRKLDALSVGWQPSARLGVHFSYSRAANVFLAGTRRAALSNSSLFAGINYNLTRDSRLSVRFSQQGIETSAVGLSAPLRLDTRGATLTHSMRFGGRWTNDFEGGFTSTRESSAGAQFERGQNLRDELRRTWERWSASAYFSYTRNTPSLAGLVARNPDLLPPLLRRAYEIDPARFLVLNGELLPSILGGVMLPETRSLDAGLRLQGTFSRYTISGDVRYSGGEVFARPQRNVLATFNADVRLDAANSVRVSGARSFALNGAGGQSALTISYVHRFGGGGGGFQFTRLFGLGRGQVAGRVFFDLNGDGRDDADEPGVPRMKIQMDGDRSVMTDERGRFRFPSVNPGEYAVALVSDELGVRWRASTSTSRSVFLSAGQTINVSFGITDHGFIAGRIFNDLYLTGQQSSANAPGVGDVRVSLRPLRADSNGLVYTQTIDASGTYEFRNLAPGSYVLEVDPATLPADFELPAQTSWPVTIKPMQGFYLDMPLVAQRAASGCVFIDKDGDGEYTSQHDEPAKGARVVAGKIEAFTDQQGSYILRNLPAGKVDVFVYTPDGNKIAATTFELGARPVLRSGINIAVSPYGHGPSAAARHQ